MTRRRLLRSTCFPKAEDGKELYERDCHSHCLERRASHNTDTLIQPGCSERPGHHLLKPCLTTRACEVGLRNWIWLSNTHSLVESGPEKSGIGENLGQF